MSKSELIAIRITPQQKETCKKLGISYPKIWEYGFDKLIPKKREELQNLAKKHYDLYIHYNDLYIQFDAENKQNEQKNIENVKNQVMNSFNPDFYIGKTIDGIKITKKLLEEWDVY